MRPAGQWQRPVPGRQQPGQLVGQQHGAASADAGHRQRPHQRDRDHRQYYSRALLANGTARCWGLNINGPLGMGTRTTRRAPVPPSGFQRGGDRRRRTRAARCALWLTAACAAGASIARGARRRQRHHDPAHASGRQGSSSTRWPSRRAWTYVRAARGRRCQLLGQQLRRAARRRHQHGSADPDQDHRLQCGRHHRRQRAHSRAAGRRGAQCWGQNPSAPSGTGRRRPDCPRRR